MFTKFLVSLTALAVLLSLPGWSQAIAQASEPVTATAEANPLPAIEAASAILYTPEMRVLFEEMTLVWLQDEPAYAYAITACAGNGLNYIQPLADGPVILIPNAGDLSVAGSNVSIKLHPDGEIEFIPRTQGQRIRVPIDVGDKLAGEEVLSLSLEEALELMAEEKLIWTAKERGPYGNGHGLPGHIAECDPLYPGL
ncbi:MAG: hypothetical protein HS126_35045 [Anaerolineales bacterium]|nr:hypothetical protein [Anaerolineales bacterium]